MEEEFLLLNTVNIINRFFVGEEQKQGQTLMMKITLKLEILVLEVIAQMFFLKNS